MLDVSDESIDVNVLSVDEDLCVILSGPEQTTKSSTRQNLFFRLLVNGDARVEI